MRLSPLGYRLGLLEEDQYERFRQKQENIDRLWKELGRESLSPEEINPHLEAIGSHPVKQKRKAIDFLPRPRFTLDMLEVCASTQSIFDGMDEETKEAFEIQAKYAGFVEKEREMVEKMHRLQSVRLQRHLDYQQIKGLSSEAVEKLTHHQPETVGDASRISGVTPSDVSVLLVHLGR